MYVKEEYIVTIKPKPLLFVSSYDKKFNGKSWETDLGLNVTAMDYRQYDNAIGRFNSIDVLSELAYDITPYRFGLNNPIFWADPIGLFETRKEAREYRREHGISGRIVKGDDGIYSINDKKNSISYFKPEAGLEPSTTGLDGVATAPLVNAELKENNVVSTGKKFNDYAGLALAPIEYLPGTFRLGTAAQGFSPKYYGNGWGGNQFATTFKFSNIGSKLGVVGAVIGTALDAKGMANYYNPKYGPNSPNSVHPGKAGLNLGMAVYGLRVNPIASIFYSGIDTFYESRNGNGSGWEGAMKDTAIMQAEFDRVINQNSGMAPQYIFPYGSQKF
jgi:hypothetical protein